MVELDTSNLKNKLISPSQTKVVILGQDPYPQPDIATGIAFGVNPEADAQPSLDIILDELATSYYNNPCMELTEIDRTLEEWVQQGVLLLNASLTCTEYNPEDFECLFQKGTHSYYWRMVLMESLYEWMNTNLENIVFVFMGKKAQYYNKFINLDKHTVINVYHPVYDYRMNKNMFRGSFVFNNINKALEGYNKTKIEWKKISQN